MQTRHADQRPRAARRARWSWCGALALLICAPAKSRGQAPTPAGGLRYTVVPLAGYTPETSGLAAAVLMLFLPGPPARRSTINLAAAGTLKGQLRLSAGARLLAFDEGLLMQVALRGTRWNAEFFGVGSQVGRLSETYDSAGYGGRLEALGRLTDGLYLGPAVEAATDRFDSADDGLLRRSGVRGARGGARAGGGATLLWDRRDRRMATRRGHLLAARAMWFGGDHAWQATAIDLRLFATWPAVGTVAVQALARFTDGDVPVYALPGLGGPNQSRGIFADRFRDRHATTSQIELRRPLFWRLVGAVFASVGRVAPRVDGLGDAPLHWAGGGGLRCVLDRDTGVSLRLDFGASADDFGTYFSIGESF